MSNKKAGALLWRRMHIQLPAGVTDVPTGLTQVNQSFAGMSPLEPGFGTPSRIEVIPLAPTAAWALITHAEPVLNADGTIHVVFTNGGTTVTINVLFWDPHSMVGPGQADAY